MYTLIILIGNIGSGKSTHAKKLAAKGYVVVSKDAIRYMLGAGKYIFDMRLEEAIHKATIELVKDLSTKGENIVIDETNMTAASRMPYLEIARGYRKKAIILPKLSMEEAVIRRLGDNHGNASKEVWEEVFERKDVQYQFPLEEEGFDEVLIL